MERYVEQRRHERSLQDRKSAYQSNQPQLVDSTAALGADMGKTKGKPPGAKGKGKGKQKDAPALLIQVGEAEQRATGRGHLPRHRSRTIQMRSATSSTLVLAVETVAMQAMLVSLSTSA